MTQIVLNNSNSPSDNFAIGMRWRVSAGGTLSVNSSFSIKWTSRLIVINQGRASSGIFRGFLGLGLPSTGVVQGVGGSADRTVTAEGILLEPWEALYFVWLPGSDQRSVSEASNYRIGYYSADVIIPAEWILLAQHNGDNGLVWFATGHYLASGQTVTASNKLANNSVSNSELAVMSPATFKGNGLSTDSSPQDVSIIRLVELLPDLVGADPGTSSGARGLAPTPTAEDANRILMGNGGWGWEVLFDSATLGPHTIAAGASTGLIPLPVSGAKSENSAAIVCPASGLPIGVILQISHISSTGIVSFRLINTTTSSVSISSQIYKAVVFQL